MTRQQLGDCEAALAQEQAANLQLMADKETLQEVS